MKEYITFIERQYSLIPKVIRVDNAMELVSKEVKNWMKEKVIKLEITAPYAHSSNRVAEWFNHTLMELTRAILIARDIPSYLWEVAVEYTAYIHNLAPSQALGGKPPEEGSSGKKPNISYFREFGCNVWVLTEGKNLSKLESKSQKFTFVGFLDGSKAIWYYDPKTQSIYVPRNFIFTEPPKTAEFTSRDKSQLEKENRSQNDLQLIPEPQRSNSKGDMQQTATNSHSTPTEMHSKHSSMTQKPSTLSKHSTASMNTNLQEEKPCHSSRDLQDHNYKALGNPDSRLPLAPKEGKMHLEMTPERHFANLVWSYLAGAETDFDDVSWTLDEAKALREWPNWKEAMNEEMNVIDVMKIYTVEELPPGRSPIGSKWVFTKKFNQNGHFSQYKAQLVAQGYSQIPGIDFFKTFAPVVHSESIQAALGIAAIEDLEIAQMDVQGAYLNGWLEEEIYMQQPEGYNDGTGWVCQLHKTLYGLKQSRQMMCSVMASSKRTSEWQWTPTTLNLTLTLHLSPMYWIWVFQVR